jgi:hypothetical protein
MFTFQVQNPAIPLPRFGPPIYLKTKKKKKGRTWFAQAYRGSN